MGFDLFFMGKAKHFSKLILKLRNIQQLTELYQYILFFYYCILFLFYFLESLFQYDASRVILENFTWKKLSDGL